MRMPVKKLTGKISIARTRNDAIWIRVEDEISQMRVIEVEMTPEVFGNVVTGLGYQPCEFDFNDSGLVGMKAENKTEIVTLPPGESPYGMSEGREREILSPYCVDGWRPRWGDLSNGHNIVRPKKGEKDDGVTRMAVVFFRHVDPMTGKPVEAEK